MIHPNGLSPGAIRQVSLVHCMQDFEYEDDGDEETGQDAGIENKYYTAKSTLLERRYLVVYLLTCDTDQAIKKMILMRQSVKWRTWSTWKRRKAIGE